MAAPVVIDESYERLGSMLDTITRECLREKCAELALLLHDGQDAPVLLDEIEELARDAWALREDDDN
jgi:hypothetical protein